MLGFLPRAVFPAVYLTRVRCARTRGSCVREARDAGRRDQQCQGPETERQSGQGGDAAHQQRPAGVAEFPAELTHPPNSPPAARRSEPAAPIAEGATLLSLDGEAGREYWLGYRNFYVITRYNHSPMYALAVHQLAQAIRAGTPG